MKENDMTQQHTTQRGADGAGRRVTSERVEGYLMILPQWEYPDETIIAICRDWLDMDAREAKYREAVSELFAAIRGVDYRVGTYQAIGDPMWHAAHGVYPHETAGFYKPDTNRVWKAMTALAALDAPDATEGDDDDA